MFLQRFDVPSAKRDKRVSRTVGETERVTACVQEGFDLFVNGEDRDGESSHVEGRGEFTHREPTGPQSLFLPGCVGRGRLQ